MVVGRKPIKILFLIDELLKGGTENQLIWLVENLPRDKFDPVLCVIRSNTYTETLTLKTPLVIIGERSLPLWKNFVLIRRLYKLISSSNFDIVQTQFQESEIYAFFSAKMCSRRPILISTRRNLYHWKNEKKITYYVIKNLVRNVNYVLTNSFAVKNKCQILEKVPDSQINVIQNAVDLSRFENIDKNKIRKEFGFKPTDIVVGVVGNWRLVKGLKFFIEAASLVSAKKKGIQFVLVGCGPLEKTLKEDIQQRALDNVVMLGNDTSIASIITAFDIAVQPSLSESFSNVLVEYMAAAKPIVATRVGDAEMVIDHEINGLLVEPANAVEIAKSILKMIDYPNEARDMGIQAQLKVRGLWDQRDILRQYEEFYLNCIIKN